MKGRGPEIKASALWGWLYVLANPNTGHRAYKWADPQSALAGPPCQTVSFQFSNRPHLNIRRGNVNIHM